MWILIVMYLKDTDLNTWNEKPGAERTVQAMDNHNLVRCGCLGYHTNNVHNMKQNESKG